MYTPPYDIPHRLAYTVGYSFHLLGTGLVEKQECLRLWWGVLDPPQKVVPKYLAALVAGQQSFPLHMETGEFSKALPSKVAHVYEGVPV